MKKSLVTREILEKYGIVDIKWDDVLQEYVITRYWKLSGKSNKYGHRTLKVRTVHNNTKYAPKSYYKAISFSYGRQHLTISLQRVVYAWFVGPVDLEHEVDHIDHDKLNNRIENLRLLTHAENMERRFLKINQYYYIKGEKTDE